MRGLGVSNQALSNAYGTYQQNVNDINAQYDELERANKAEYRDAINALSGELSAYLAEVGNNFNIEDYNARKQAYINSGMYTAEELAAAEALMTDAEKNIIKGKESSQASDFTTPEKPFEYNGKYYQIESKLDKNANEVFRNSDLKKQLKDMGYTNLYDKDIPNGTTITTRVDNRGSNDFNFWDDIGAGLLSPFAAGAWDSWFNWNEISMTYYDGDWYLSKVISV